jgi:hypothetical protein
VLSAMGESWSSELGLSSGFRSCGLVAGFGLGNAFQAYQEFIEMLCAAEVALLYLRQTRRGSLLPRFGRELAVLFSRRVHGISVGQHTDCSLNLSQV